MGFLADTIDNVGSFLNLPDYGISEAANNNKATVNTGSKQFSSNVGLGGNNTIQIVGYNADGSPKTVTNPNIALINNAYNAKNTSATNSVGGGGGGGATTNAVVGGSGAYDAQASAAAAAQARATANQRAQLQAQLDQLDGQQGIGLGNIDNSFNLSANRLDEQNAAAQRDYNTSTQGNTQNYVNTRNSVIAQTRAQANALQRLLGLAGAGNSSAAYEQAPYAAALQGSQNLNGAQQTFGTNQRTLDTNWQDTQRSYKNSLDDLNNQKYQQQNSLRSSIAQTRASLLSGLQSADGSSAYQGQINSLLGQVTGLGNQYANPVVRVSDLAYKAPDLSSYSLDGLQAASNGQTGAASDISPLFQSLLDQKRDQYGNIIAA